jgi:nucleoside-diphosphate-sugar epimerase
MQRAIVTGAGGFVGQWLCRELARQGYSVIAVVRGENSNVTLLKELNNIDIVSCSLEELPQLPARIPNTAEFFFHLAWGGTVEMTARMWICSSMMCGPPPKRYRRQRPADAIRLFSPEA